MTGHTHGEGVGTVGTHPFGANPSGRGPSGSGGSAGGQLVVQETVGAPLLPE